MRRMVGVIRDEIAKKLSSPEFRKALLERAIEHAVIGLQQGLFEVGQDYVASRRERRWYPEEGGGKRRAAASGYRVRRAGGEGSHTADDVIEIYHLQGRRCCFYCGKPLLPGAFHVDHYTPVARGGSDHPRNLVVTCEPCNLSKGAKTAEEYLRDSGLAEAFWKATEDFGLWAARRSRRPPQ